MNWRKDDYSWSLTLPFYFPFYHRTYNSVRVSSNGFLQFATSTSASDGTNTTDELIQYVRIAPLWDDLRTNGTDDDIRVDDTQSNRIIIQWDATNEADGTDVNFGVVLFENGTIRFDYGLENTNLTPTIGISMGMQSAYLLSVYDAQATLTNANSVRIETVGGVTFADIGAYEFIGSSFDTDPPTVTGTDPAFIDEGGRQRMFSDQIGVSFSEPLDPIDANAPANYELRDDGPNDEFGDGDDNIYVLAPHYTPGSLDVTLHISGGLLPPENYRLTIYGDTSLHDLSGLRLDGDEDTLEGGNYVRTFILPIPVDAVDDVAQVQENTGPTVIDVLANDTFEAAAPITAATNGAHGVVAITGGGTSLTYEPDTHYFGPDSFTYTIADGGESDTATVTVTVDEFPTDTDGDGCVNVLDLMVVRGQLGKEGSAINPPEADIDGDEIVNVLDLLAVRGALGTGDGCAQ